MNVSHPYVHRKYVCTLESDDYLTDTAVEQMITGWQKYEADSNIGIVTFLKGTSVDSPSCMACEEDEGRPVDIMRYRRKCIHSADACEVIRAELFKKTVSDI